MKNNTYLLLVTFVAAMGGLLFGYDWVVIGGAKPFYEVFFNIGDSPPLLNNALKASGTFWLYGIICALGYIFIYRNLPETKGKSLEEIEEELKN